MRIEGELSGDPSSNGDTSNGKLKEKDDDYASGKETPDIIALANQQAPDATALARQLALAIKRAARDMSGDTPKQYTFEEWVEFTRLIRFSAVGGPAESFKEEEENGVIVSRIPCKLIFLFHVAYCKHATLMMCYDLVNQFIISL